MVVVVPAQQSKKKAARKQTTTSRVSAPKKKTPAKKTAKSGQTGKKASTKKAPAPTVNSLKSEQVQVRKQIQEQERKLQANERDVKKRLQNLMVINNEIADKRRTIDTIRQDITRLDGDISVLDNQLHTLQAELEERKQRYMKSMRYMHRNRNIQSQLMFVFSAKHLSEMYRRIRFVREYASYQQAQGEAVQHMQQQVAEAYEELKSTKRLKNDLLYKGEQERKSLESKQVEQQQVVTSLKKEQKAIQGIIAQQKKRDAELNARRLPVRRPGQRQRPSARPRPRLGRSVQRNWLGRRRLPRLRRGRMRVVSPRRRPRRRRLRRRLVPLPGGVQRRKPVLRLLPGRQRRPERQRSVVPLRRRRRESVRSLPKRERRRRSLSCLLRTSV